MNLLPKASRTLSNPSLAMECLGGQYTAEVVIVHWQSPIATFLLSLEVVFPECWNLVMLNVAFDSDSGATVGFPTGILGMVEVITVYFEIVFVLVYP